MNAVLSRTEARALACVLDTVIPPSDDGRLPGAGEIGLAASIDAAMAANPDLVPAVRLGLVAFEETIRGIGVAAFAALPLDERVQWLTELGASQPAFVPSLVFHVYVAYYQHPRVMRALGLEARPPHPLGYPMAPMDTSLLDGVRKRKPFFRIC